MRCRGWIPQDERTAVCGELASRVDQHLDARRVHELDAGEVEYDRLVRTHVRLDRVAQTFGGGHVDLALDVDHCGTVNSYDFGRKGTVRHFQSLPSPRFAGSVTSLVLSIGRDGCSRRCSVVNRWWSVVKWDYRLFRGRGRLHHIGSVGIADFGKSGTR
jgi:hypothetical protein